MTALLQQDESELARWVAVPDAVSSLYKQAAPMAAKIRKVVKGLPAMPGYGIVWWHPAAHKAWVTLGDSDDQTVHQKWVNALHNLGITDVRSESEGNPPDYDEWIRIKTAAPLGFVGDAWGTANKAIGGPSPLTNAIVGGLLTGGLGYAGGAALEQLFPKRYLERGRLRKTLGLLGLGAGALPGVYKGDVYARNDDTSLLQGMLTRDTAPVKQALQRASDALAMIPINAAFAKAADYAGGAFDDAGGSMDVQSVPVDAFNRAVWNDVRKGVAASQNPWGSKSSWGSNEQSLHTPSALGAATTGLMSGIGEMQGSSLLSPRDVITGIASAGVGLATANVAGRALSAMAGLTPGAQEQLQNLGLWAGMLRTVIPPVFGY